MENTRRKADDAAFKLKTINLAVEEGNRAAGCKFGISESMVRRWRRQREELTQFYCCATDTVKKSIYLIKSDKKSLHVASFCVNMS